MHDDNDFLSRVSITAVWHALGGGEIRRKRAVAFWRNGNGWSVSIDEDKGAWFDFVSGEGGGVLALIETVLGCDRKSALRWAADFAGVPFGRTLTLEEKRDFARRRAAAEREADQLVAWRKRMMDALRDYRDRNARLYHLLVWRIVNAYYSGDGELARLMDEADDAEEKWQRSAHALDTWRSASWPDVLRVFRRARRAA